VKLEDYLGFSAVASFGLWWVLFPNSVIVFYTWLSRGRAKISNAPAKDAKFAVRLSGVIWLVLTMCVMTHYLIYGK
jgi:succinate-acetate transporter protein